MKHITDYIFEQQHTFDDVPFNPVDSLVLSCIGYFNLECAPFEELAGKPSVSLQQVIAQSKASELTKDIWLENSSRTPDFLRGLAQSKRYQDIKLGYYVNEISEEAEKQFSAVSIVLPHKRTYLSYRGTDMSFTGWKEDFNLGYKPVITSQASALAYLDGVARTLPGKLLVGGHSKGGNLAEYAALMVEKPLFDRILKVFNHDGPSFLKDPSPRITSATYLEKLHKTVPGSSPIGMIMEKRLCYHIVKSDGVSVLQHEPFSWGVQGNDFIYKGRQNKDAVVFDAAFNTLIAESSDEERERFVETLYELFKSTDTTSWGEFSSKPLSNALKVITTGTELDKKTHELMTTFISKFIKSLAGEIIS